MSLLRLEVFETPDTRSQSTVVTDMGALEEARLAAFEQGYSAGWEDAGAAQAEDQTRIRVDLARNIQALSFTYHEAKAHVLGAMEPLLTDILGRLLPEVVRPAIGQIVLDALLPMAREMSEAPIILVLNPLARAAVEAVLTNLSGLPLTIQDEPTLGEGQIYLRLGDTETLVDTDRAIADITLALRNFLTLSKDDPYNGQLR
jgi:flagellar assembly protein FliH